MRFLCTVLAVTALATSFVPHDALAQRAKDPAAAEDMTPVKTIDGAERKALLQDVEGYLNSITTMQADFIQTHSDGSRYNGAFYMSRPGRLRFEYAPPNGDYIVADGLLVHYWDSETKNYSNAPIGSTLADFLLRKKISLSGDLTVTNVQQTPDNRVLITLFQTADRQAGQLALLIEQNPLRLKRWRIIDGTGAMTEVSLYNIQSGMRIDPRKFIYKAPKGYESEVDKR
jgi:outer membrane lipoprotein-sorting protein